MREGTTREGPTAWRIAVLGEVLFDCFPDGMRLGGAPFNVAWHLAGLGLAPRLISRVGNDALAASILKAMHGHGMDTGSLQTDAVFPTGRVTVTLDGAGGHAFDILPDQAYDHIDGAAPPAGPPADLAYFGTLALRAPGSRKAILEAVAACPGVRLLDVNLRAGCWTAESLSAALRHASVAKLNDDELAALSGMHHLSGTLADRAQGLREAFALDGVCLTEGQYGAHWIDAHSHTRVAAPSTRVVDTVGAGDGFAAVLATGLLAEWPIPLTLQRAARFAAAVCGVRGACPDSPAFYAPFRAEWGLAP